MTSQHQDDCGCVFCRDEPQLQITVHQDDGTGNCTACGTEWPAECAVEKNAVWVAEVGHE